MNNLYTNSKNSKGFTLLELVASLAIFTIIIVMISNVVIINLRIAMINQARTRTREETGYVLKQMKRDVRNAFRVRIIDASPDILVAESDIETGSAVFCWTTDEGSTGTTQISKYQAITASFDSLTACGAEGADFDLITRMPSDIEVIEWELGEPDSNLSGNVDVADEDSVRQIIIIIGAQVDLPIKDDQSFSGSIFIKKQTIIATRNFISESY